MLYIEGILPKGPYLPCIRKCVCVCVCVCVCGGGGGGGGGFWQDTLDMFYTAVLCSPTALLCVVF